MHMIEWPCSLYIMICIKFYVALICAALIVASDPDARTGVAFERL